MHRWTAPADLLEASSLEIGRNKSLESRYIEQWVQLGEIITLPRIFNRDEI